MFPTDANAGPVIVLIFRRLGRTASFASQSSLNQIRLHGADADENDGAAATIDGYRAPDLCSAGRLGGRPKG
jgi:hypothetical protein